MIMEFKRRLRVLGLHRWMLVALLPTMLLLQACVGPQEYLLTRGDMEDRLGKQLGKPKRFLDLYEARLERPTVDSMVEEGRLRLRQPLALQELSSQRMYAAEVVLNGKPEIAEKGRALRLSDIQLERVHVPGLAGGSRLIEAALTSWFELDQRSWIVYRADQRIDQQLKIRELKVLPEGLLLKIDGETIAKEAAVLPEGGVKPKGPGESPSQPATLPPPTRPGASI